MKKLLPFAILVVLAPAFSCSDNDEPTEVPGSGNIVTETRTVANFNSVKLLGPGLLAIDRSGAETLEITADENLMQFITSEVSNGQLMIGIEDAINALPTVPVIYKLTVDELVEIMSVGNSAIEALDVAADSFTVFLSGNGRITVGGAVLYQLVTLTASGTYEAWQLESAVARVSVRNTNFAGVSVSDTLFAQVLECGRIDYIGDPVVFKDVSECGTVGRR